MKFTLSWLKDHLETSASLDQICDKLTAIGLEVEGVENRALTLAPFVVAKILSAEKHPQADRLKVCMVDDGSGKPLQVVCGAPNARAGIKAVLARPGDVIPETGQALKLGVIRGVESQGMMCATDELCIGDEHSGIIELPEDAPVGGNFAQYAGYDDPVIEINLTPNRPDCAGVRGIARDLAAAGMGTLKASAAELAEVAEGRFDKLSDRAVAGTKVKLDFPPDQSKACPAFSGRTIRNIRNGQSPEWMQRRLRAIGLRPISALVDITNYLTFDLCRPLHVFDVDKLRGDLTVRPAKDGEKFAALNDKEYLLQTGMTVICDDSGVLSLAGVMGGSSTGCGAATTSVFIESAAFDPVRTARTGRALQLTSDARYRFERGVDPASMLDGLKIASRMVVEFCGTPATVVGEIVTAGDPSVPPRKISYKPERCRTLAGIDVPETEQRRVLSALGFGVAAANGGGMEITAPSWRPDVEGSADIVEEIARIKGYDAIAPVSLTRDCAVTAAAVDSLDKKASAARRALASRGLMEAVTWSFMQQSVAEKLGGGGESLRLVNPISADLDCMRPSIVGNLAAAAGRNAARGFSDVGLFEVGPVYADASPEGQGLSACAVRSGNTPRHWAEKSRPVDAFDAKADALAALAAAGIPAAGAQTTTDAPAWYHPGRSGCLRLGPTLLAAFGELHPAFLSTLGISGMAVVACEIPLSALPQLKTQSAKGGCAATKPLLKLEDLQPLTRDYAFVVEKSVTAEKMLKAVKSADRNLIREVTVFDVYEGGNIGADRKSIALGVAIQPTDHTLTEAELEGLSARIAATVAKATGGTMRG